jgi:crotonobetainyl-CoA:carnitine CoA-transferase CaiB-like acyl-CoA transferase
MLDRPKLSPAAQTFPEPATGLPLSGFRIVELTTAWAGPMAGRILACLGAEVVHIEPANNLDSWRSYTALPLLQRYPKQDVGERRYNRASLFNSQNTDKLSLTLDLKAPGGKDTFRDLIGNADGLITNFTPGMLQRLGFGNDVLWSINARLCVVEMPAYGNSGVMKGWTALGPTMEQVAGMCAAVGYGDGRPVSTGPAYLDPIGAFHGSAAMLTALLHRQHSGEAQHVEVPQVEAAMQLIGEILLCAVETGKNPPVNGNRLPHSAPHDVFPAIGTDEWVAIDVTSDAEWAALCKIIGRPELATDPRFAATAERVRRQDELAEPIAAWSKQQDKHAAAKLLQDAGVPAAAVYKANDTLTCDYLNAREFSIPLDHPEAGRHLHQGLPYRFAKTPVKHRRAAPCLGEHNHYVLKNILGRSDAEVEALERAGTIRSVPDT